MYRKIDKSRLIQRGCTSVDKLRSTKFPKGQGTEWDFFFFLGGGGGLLMFQQCFWCIPDVPDTFWGH